MPKTKPNAGKYSAGATSQITNHGSDILYTGYIVRIVKQLCGFYRICLNGLIFQKLVEFSSIAHDKKWLFIAIAHHITSD